MALKAGSYDAVFDSADHFKEVIRLTRETLPLIRAKGARDIMKVIVAMLQPIV